MSGFNNFMPYGNNSYNGYGQQQPYQDQQLNRLLEQALQQKTQQQQVQTNMDFIVVPKMEDAKDYIVQNGQTRWFRNSSKPEIYVKSVSNIGEPNFGAYNLVPLDINSNIIPDDKSVVSQEFVPVKDFNDLQTQVNNMQNTINNYVGMIGKYLQQDKTETKGRSNNKSAQSQKGGD